MKYLLAFKRISPVSRTEEIFTALYETVEEAQRVVEFESVSPPNFLGIWKLGKPLALTFQVKEKPVKTTVKESTHEWEDK